MDEVARARLKRANAKVAEALREAGYSVSEAHAAFLSAVQKLSMTSGLAQEIQIECVLGMGLGGLIDGGYTDEQILNMVSRKFLEVRAIVESIKP